MITTDIKEKVNYLKDIYNQQHYFIDRHDSMAERFINILLVEITALAIILSLVTDITTYLTIKYIALAFYIISFSITLIKLFLVIRPLSAIAKDEKNEKILRAENKNWIDASLIYYRGINSQRKESIKREKSPSEDYLDKIDENNISKDIVQQIFILAQYSDYKRKQIEKSVKWVIGTTIIGIVVALLLLAL